MYVSFLRADNILGILGKEHLCSLMNHTITSSDQNIFLFQSVNKFKAGHPFTFKSGTKILIL